MQSVICDMSDYVSNSGQADSVVSKPPPEVAVRGKTGAPVERLGGQEQQTVIVLGR